MTLSRLRKGSEIQISPETVQIAYFIPGKSLYFLSSVIPSRRRTKFGVPLIAGGCIDRRGEAAVKPVGSGRLWSLSVFIA